MLYRDGLVFAFAYTLTMLVCVYGLRLPQFVTGNVDLVNEYYFTRPFFSFGLDFVLVSLYMLFAWTLWNALQIESTIGQIVVLGCVTAGLTTLFWLYFSRQPLDPLRFFSRWFHTVGVRSVVYDVILLVIVYLVFTAIKSFLPQ
jgi:hypothetical protein